MHARSHSRRGHLLARQALGGLLIPGHRDQHGGWCGVAQDRYVRAAMLDVIEQGAEAAAGLLAADLLVRGPAGERAGQRDCRPPRPAGA